MASNGVRDLRVWQEAVALGGDAVRLLKTGVRRETKAFTDEILRVAAIPASCIAESHAHSSVGEQRECYLRAKRALVELETRLAIARHAEVLSATAAAQLNTRVAAVMQLLGGYLSFIDRQVPREKAIVAEAK